MATKKQNRRYNVRRVRRVLNRALDFFTGASGKRLNQSHWGGGLRLNDVRDSSKNKD